MYRDFQPISSRKITYNITHTVNVLVLVVSLGCSIEILGVSLVVVLTVSYFVILCLMEKSRTADSGCISTHIS